MEHNAPPQWRQLFSLDPDFYEDYEQKPVKWGFQNESGVSVGEITFLRTYSRLKDDETKETWPEVCKRVVEGCYSEQKRHAQSIRIPWSDEKAQESAQEMFDRMFNFKFLPPGRGLWMMGTNYVHEKRNGAALNNCAFISTENIAEDPVWPFMFLMDASMLGIGVGFDTKGAGEITIQSPSWIKGYYYMVPDSREGWVDSVATILRAFFNGDHLPNFDYSRVRPAGEPIRGFGGTTSGPEPLIELHEALHALLSPLEGQQITSRTITDIFNLIGKCVVSGNVRRSAEIALGSINDLDFINLKDWTRPENKARCDLDTGWSWLSNNTVVAEEGEDVDLDWFSDKMSRNGEPGIFWLGRARDYGRLADPPNYRDRRAMGTNPCSEQTLESGEMCCLVETFPSHHDTLDDYLRTLKFAYLYAKTVTLLPTHWRSTNAIMQRNRRIGCSVSGVAQFVEEHGYDKLTQWLDRGYKEVQYRDSQYSEWLCIRESIKTTSVKPSGSVSLLAGVTPGVHWPVANNYIRRMRMATDDPLLAVLMSAGYHAEPAKGNASTTMVVEIPVKGPKVRTEEQVSVYEKMALAATAQKWWADNQVSCTITFDPERPEDLAAALKINAGSFKSISCMPMSKGAYAQMPYEEISGEEYERRVAGLKEVDFGIIYRRETEKAMDAIGERYCDTESCTI